MFGRAVRLSEQRTLRRTLKQYQRVNNAQALFSWGERRKPCESTHLGCRP